MPSSPIWVVGILGEGLTLGDTLAFPGEMAVDDPEPVDGAFFLWDANSGAMVSSGALSTGSRFQYLDLIQLNDEALTILHATAVPTPQ